MVRLPNDLQFGSCNENIILSDPGFQFGTPSHINFLKQNTISSEVRLHVIIEPTRSKTFLRNTQDPNQYSPEKRRPRVRPILG